MLFAHSPIPLKSVGVAFAPVFAVTLLLLLCCCYFVAAVVVSLLQLLLFLLTYLQGV